MVGLKEGGNCPAASASPCRFSGWTRRLVTVSANANRSSDWSCSNSSRQPSCSRSLSPPPAEAIAMVTSRGAEGEPGRSASNPRLPRPPQPLLCNPSNLPRALRRSASLLCVTEKQSPPPPASLLAHFATSVERVRLESGSVGKRGCFLHRSWRWSVCVVERTPGLVVCQRVEGNLVGEVFLFRQIFLRKVGAVSR